MPSRQERDKERRASGPVGVRLQFRPLVSADRQKELRDSQRREPPLVSTAPRSHRGATLERPRTEVQPPHRGLPSRRLGTPRHPAPPRDRGVSFEGGGGARRPCQSLRRGRLRAASSSAPLPRAPLPPPPGPRRNDGRSRVWGRRQDRVAGWVGQVIAPGTCPQESDLSVGPRFHRRRRRPSVTSVPAAAAAAAAAEDSQLQTLASLRSRRRRRRRRQRSPVSNCSRLLRPARSTLRVPDPPLGPRQLPVPAAPAALAVLFPTPTGQPPPPPPPPPQPPSSGQ